MHDDTPRLRWKLAVIEELVKGKDRLIRSAVIRTSNGVTNRPIAKLYPMEITATTLKESVPEIEQDLVVPKDDECDEITGHSIVPTRKAARDEGSSTFIRLVSDPRRPPGGCRGD